MLIYGEEPHKYSAAIQMRIELRMSGTKKEPELANG